MTVAIPNPTSLTGLVEAAEGSVVSRVVLRNGGCTMTAFAFAEGEGLTEHATPHPAVILLLEGSLRITLGEGGESGEEGSARGSTHEMKAGDMLQIPASVPHTLHPGQPSKMLLILIKDAASG